MNLGFIARAGGRLPLAEIFTDIANATEGVQAHTLDLDNLDNIKETCDFYIRLGDDGYEQLPSYIKPVAWWITDTHLPKAYKKIKQRVADYDLIFCAQKEGAYRIRKDTGKNAYWVPCATTKAPVGFNFRGEDEKRWDVCFVGTSDKHSLRKVVLEQIRINCPNAFVGKLPWAKIREYYSRAKVVVNYSINNDINLRFFETMGAGALLLTNRINNNGFDDLFEDGENLVVYDNIMQDLPKKLNYYIKDKLKREQIARAGFNLVNQKHTFTNRFRQMLEIINKQK